MCKIWFLYVGKTLETERVEKENIWTESYPSWFPAEPSLPATSPRHQADEE